MGLGPASTAVTKRHPTRFLHVGKMRRGTRIGLITTAVVVAAVLVALFMKIYNETAPPSSSAAQAPSATPSPTDGGRDPKATKVPATRGQAQTGTVSAFPSSLVNQLGHANKSGPPHTVKLTVTTAGDIARVGYLVPTSDSVPYANIGAPTSPWSLTMTAHGNGYLAALFLQAGRSGEPVTCRIMIDGVTKSVRTTNGAYARQMCIA